jgi:hypothetical protein
MRHSEVDRGGAVAEQSTMSMWIREAAQSSRALAGKLMGVEPLTPAEQALVDAGLTRRLAVGLGGRVAGETEQELREDARWLAEAVVRPDDDPAVRQPAEPARGDVERDEQGRFAPRGHFGGGMGGLVPAPGPPSMNGLLRAEREQRRQDRFGRARRLDDGRIEIRTNGR